MKKLITVAGESVLRRCELLPDAYGTCQFFYIGCKAFDGNHSFVPNALQPTSNQVPGRLPRAGNTTIIFRDLYVNELVACKHNGLLGVALLQRHVETVEHNSGGGMTDVTDQPYHVRCRVHQVGFETIERLQGNSHTVVLCHLAYTMEVGHRTIPLFLSLLRRQHSHLAHCRIHWPRHKGGTYQL